MASSEWLVYVDENANRSAGAGVILFAVAGALGSAGSWWHFQAQDSSVSYSIGSGWSQHLMIVAMFLMMSFGAISVATRKRMPSGFVVTVSAANVVVTVVTCFTSESAGAHAFTQIWGVSNYELYPSFGLAVYAVATIGLLVLAIRSVVRH